MLSKAQMYRRTFPRHVWGNFCSRTGSSSKCPQDSEDAPKYNLTLLRQRYVTNQKPWPVNNWTVHGLSPLISSIGLSLSHPTLHLQREPWSPSLLTLMHFVPNLLTAVEMPKGHVTAFEFFKSLFLKLLYIFSNTPTLLIHPIYCPTTVKAKLKVL